MNKKAIIFKGGIVELSELIVKYQDWLEKSRGHTIYIPIKWRGMPFELRLVLSFLEKQRLHYIKVKNKNLGR